MNDYRICEEMKMPVMSKEPIRDVSLSGKMGAAREKAQAALKMVHQIDYLLFGGGLSDDTGTHNPSCFSEDLAITDEVLLAVCSELETLMKRLGV